MKFLIIVLLFGFAIGLPVDEKKSSPDNSIQEVKDANPQENDIVRKENIDVSNDDEAHEDINILEGHSNVDKSPIAEKTEEEKVIEHDPMKTDSESYVEQKSDEKDPIHLNEFQRKSTLEESVAEVQPEPTFENDPEKQSHLKQDDPIDVEESELKPIPDDIEIASLDELDSDPAILNQEPRLEDPLLIVEDEGTNDPVFLAIEPEKTLGEPLSIVESEPVLLDEVENGSPVQDLNPILEEPLPVADEAKNDPILIKSETNLEGSESNVGEIITFNEEENDPSQLQPESGLNFEETDNEFGSMDETEDNPISSNLEPEIFIVEEPISMAEFDQIDEELSKSELQAGEDEPISIAEPEMVESEPFEELDQSIALVPLTIRRNSYQPTNPQLTENEPVNIIPEEPTYELNPAENSGLIKAMYDNVPMENQEKSFNDDMPELFPVDVEPELRIIQFPDTFPSVDEYEPMQNENIDSQVFENQDEYMVPFIKSERIDPAMVMDTYGEEDVKGDMLNSEIDEQMPLIEDPIFIERNDPLVDDMINSPYATYMEDPNLEMYDTENERFKKEPSLEIHENDFHPEKDPSNKYVPDATMSMMGSDTFEVANPVDTGVEYQKEYEKFDESNPIMEDTNMNSEKNVPMMQNDPIVYDDFHGTPVVDRDPEYLDDYDSHVHEEPLLHEKYYDETIYPENIDNIPDYNDYSQYNQYGTKFPMERDSPYHTDFHIDRTGALPMYENINEFGPVSDFTYQINDGYEGFPLSHDNTDFMYGSTKAAKEPVFDNTDNEYIIKEHSDPEEIIPLRQDENKESISFKIDSLRKKINKPREEDTPETKPTQTEQGVNTHHLFEQNVDANPSINNNLQLMQFLKFLWQSRLSPYQHVVLLGSSPNQKTSDIPINFNPKRPLKQGPATTTGSLAGKPVPLYIYIDSPTPSRRFSSTPFSYSNYNFYDSFPQFRPYETYTFTTKPVYTNRYYSTGYKPSKSYVRNKYFD